VEISVGKPPKNIFLKKRGANLPLIAGKIEEKIGIICTGFQKKLYY
jgi:hypothetical protein